MKIFERLLKKLQDSEMEYQICQLDDGDFGECCEDTIKIDSINVIAEVVIHELLHAIYPKKKEREVKQLTLRVFFKLNRNEKKIIIRTFLDRVKEGK